MALLAGPLAASCDSSAGSGSQHGSPAGKTIMKARKDVTDTNKTNSQRFASLDDYLIHLERVERPVGGPWYAEVSPGIYELQTGNLKLDAPNEQQTRFTRAELAGKFGFAS